MKLKKAEKKAVKAKKKRLPWYLAELPEETKKRFRELEKASDEELAKIFSRSASTRIDLSQSRGRFEQEFLNWIGIRKGPGEAYRLECLFEQWKGERHARVKARILGMQEKRKPFYRKWGLTREQVMKAFEALPDFRTHLEYHAFLYLLKPYAPVLSFADKVLRGKGNVLEVGFGHPAFLDVLRKRGYQTTGLDPNLPKDGGAVKRLNLIEGDAKKLVQFIPAENKFDLVYYKGLSDNVLRKRVDARALAARLKPGGYLIFILEHFHRRTHLLFERHGLERVTGNARFDFEFSFKFLDDGKPHNFAYYVTVLRKPEKK